jgi:photosystem II stability/assembly factor-like uncharacterized protein
VLRFVMTWVFALGIGLSLLGSAASSASAHAPPEVQRIVWKSQGELLLVSNRGLMFGSTEAGRFRLMCNEALHVNNEERPGIAYRRDGGLLAATSNGLLASLDQGCSWQPVAPFSTSFVAALAQLPDDADALIVATFGPTDSALHVTRDGGRTFRVLTQLEGRDFTQSLLVAPQDVQLLFASGTMLREGPPVRTVQYVARSRDGGASWERTELTLEPGELNVQLLAINPSDGNELLARATSASPGLNAERVLLSRDGGKTFSTALSLPAITGAAFAPDGSAAWVASSTGLYRAGATRDGFARSGGADRLTCVAYRDGALWVCGHYDGADPTRDGIGRASDPSAADFVRLMNFSEIEAPIACAEDAPSARTCGVPWLDFHNEVSRAEPSDAGLAGLDAASAEDADEDAGAEDDAATPSDEDAGRTRTSKPSGCALRTEPNSGHTLTALALCVLAMLSRIWRPGRTAGSSRIRT